MPRPAQVRLSEAQQAELKEVRDHHPKAYLREAAAAILKVGQGRSFREVALHGLLKERDPETVSGWVHDYLRDGIDGLVVKSGRGRKASFFPSGVARSQTDGAAHYRHSP